MVLEALIGPKEGERKLWLVFLLGFFYASLGLFIALWIFRDAAGLVMVFLATMAALPVFYKTMKQEEETDVAAAGERTILASHGRALLFFLVIFLGMSASFAFWYIALPQNMSGAVYGIQTQTIVTINKGVTGHFAKTELFSKIFLNNVEVLFFCLLFSFLYGAGAVFILAWNSSVIGVALGNFVRGSLFSATGALAAPPLTAYATAISTSLLRYMVHGIPEIVGYLIGALAGGIISVAVIRHDFRSKNFEKLLLDSTDLIILALSFLFIGSLIEVYITPLFF